MTTYAFQFDTTTGAILGPHVYGDSNVTLPANEIACTEAQAKGAASLWQVDLSTSPYTLVASLSGAQAVQSALIKQGFNNAVAAIPFTINGVNYTLDAAQTKQAADMAIVVAANNALNHPVAWAASTSVAQYAVQLVGSSYLFCTVAGTTGTKAPTPPTTFGTPVTDGTVTWELYGRTLELSDGSHATFTVQELVSIFQQAEVYIHYQKNKKLSLLDSIAAVTSSTTDPIATVQAIVW
jgi:hypothetical protein